MKVIGSLIPELLDDITIYNILPSISQQKWILLSRISKIWYKYIKDNLIKIEIIEDIPNSLEYISKYTNLRHIFIYNKNIDYDSWEFLTRLKKLYYLSTKYINIDVLQQLTSLQELHIPYNVKLSDITMLTNLKQINRNTYHYFGEQWTDYNLSVFTNLTTLSATSTITDKSLSLLTNLNILNIEDEYNKNITSDSISKLVNLQSLCVYCAPHYNNSFIKNLINITTLDIYEVKIDHNLSRLTNLISLTCSGEIDPQALPSLLQLRRLDLCTDDYITLNWSMGIPNNNHISMLTNLTYLNISNTNITDDGIFSLVNLVTLIAVRTEEYPNVNLSLSDNSIKKLTQLQHIVYGTYSSITLTTLHNLNIYNINMTHFDEPLLLS